MAIKINPNSIDAYYGSALSSFKLKRFEEAFSTLKSMPSNAVSLNLKNEDLVYFKALCLKKINNFKDSEKEYKSLHK